MISQQAITWTNIDPDLCPHMVSLGHNDFTLSAADIEILQVNLVSTNAADVLAPCTTRALIQYKDVVLPV